MKRVWELYGLTDPRTNQIRYIGITFRGKARFREHLSRAITGGKTHRDCWIRSLVLLGLRPIYFILEIGDDSNWQLRERFWISQHRKTLTNHTDGGDGTPGCIPTQELRRKWSEQRKGVSYLPGRIPGMKGKTHSMESRRKISVAGRGRKCTEQTKLRMSIAAKQRGISRAAIDASIAARRGRKHTDEHKQKIADSTKTRKPVVCIETGEIFPSVKAVMRRLIVPHSSVYQAIQKQCRCRGFHFQFL